MVQRAYPQGVSGDPAWEPDDAPFAPDEPDGLARAFAEVLPCHGYVVAGEGRGADWVHLVATVSPRSWLAVREGVGEAKGAKPTAGRRGENMGAFVVVCCC